MGHHYNTINGTGKNRKEAERNAIDDFLHEHGHRHSVRGIEEAKMIRKVPPKKQLTERTHYQTVVRQVDDPDAPPDQWLEEWEFELHTHA